MYKNKTFLAIIPARSGSKRLVNKNILDINGQPMLSWSIIAGLESNYIDTCVVSTDSKDIAEISRKYGAEVPFLRPERESDDFATNFDVANHTINYYKEVLNKEFDYIVFLQPTSPLRTVKHIDEAINLIFTKKADAIISVGPVKHSPMRMNILANNDSMDTFIPTDIKGLRSQDFPIYQQLNGAIYICATDKLLDEKDFLISKNSFAYRMNFNSSIDIDDIDDFIYASKLMTDNWNIN